jgi:DMSO reductase family type II enzyme chaperone
VTPPAPDGEANVDAEPEGAGEPASDSGSDRAGESASDSGSDRAGEPASDTGSDHAGDPASDAGSEDARTPESDDDPGGDGDADSARLGRVETETGARGAVYAIAARAFSEPDDELYAALADGSLDAEFAALVDRTGLDVDPPDLTVDDDHDTLAARYNDLFVIGYSEVVDGTDGTIDNQGPPVSLYESAYRSEVSWNDVNLDLARAYEYFGCEVDQDERRHHDHVRLELEFAGYLCRLAAADDVAPDADVDRARLDFHDRHLTVLLDGLTDALDDEPGTSVYGRLADFLEAFATADVDDLADRLQVGAGADREDDGEREADGADREADGDRGTGGSRATDDETQPGGAGQ